MRALTTGPRFHWFGYYDKLQFDPTQRYVLAMEVDFENRSPRPGDAIRVGMIDLRDGDRWIELGESRAWCWQQGCMLQWCPGSAFYLYDVETRQAEVVGEGVMAENGHCTYLPGRDWVLNDTYPDADRCQHPYLYHVPSGVLHPLAHFLAPLAYEGEWRCDTHPRSSPDGRLVTIDSAHGGKGRQVYLIEVGDIVGGAGIG